VKINRAFPLLMVNKYIIFDIDSNRINEINEGRVGKGISAKASHRTFVLAHILSDFFQNLR
jgi:hypothetical protein